MLGFRCADDDDVIEVGTAIDVAHFGARNGGRRGPAHIAGLQAEPLCLVEIDLDGDVRNVLLQLDMEIDHPVDIFQRCADLGGFLSQDP